MDFSTKLTLDVGKFSSGAEEINRKIAGMEEKMGSLDVAVDRLNNKLNSIGSGIDISKNTNKVLQSLGKMFGKANILAKVNSEKIGKLMSNISVDTSLLNASIGKCLGAISGFVFLAKAKIKSLQGTLNVTEFSQRLNALAGVFDSAFNNIQTKVSEHLNRLTSLFDDTFSKDIRNGIVSICNDISQSVENMAESVSKSFITVKNSIEELEKLKKNLTEKKLDTIVDPASTPEVKNRKKRAKAEVDVEKEATQKALEEEKKRMAQLKESYKNRNSLKPSLSSKSDKAAPVSISSPRTVDEVNGKTNTKEIESKAERASKSQKTISEYLQHVNSTIQTINTTFTGFISQLETNDLKIQKGIENMFKPFEEINKRFDGLHDISTKLATVFSAIKTEVSSFATEIKGYFDIINGSLKSIGNVGKSKNLEKSVNKAYNTASEKSVTAVGNIREQVEKLTEVSEKFGAAGPKVQNAVNNINEGLKSLRLTKDDASKAETYVKHLKNMAIAADKLAQASSSLRGMKDFSYADSLIGKTKTKKKERDSVETYAMSTSTMADGMASGLATMSAKLESAAGQIEQAATRIENRFQSMGWYVEQFMATMRGSAQPIAETSGAIKSMVTEFTSVIKDLADQFEITKTLIDKTKALSTASKDVINKHTGTIAAAGKGQLSSNDEVNGLAAALERLSQALGLFQGKGNSLSSAIKGLVVPTKTLRNMQMLSATISTLGSKVIDLQANATGARTILAEMGVGNKTSQAVSNLKTTIDDYKELQNVKPFPKTTEESFDKIELKLKNLVGTFEKLAPSMEAALKPVPTSLDVIAKGIGESFSRIEQKFHSLGWYFEQFVATMRGSGQPIKETSNSLRAMVVELSTVVKDLGDQFKATNELIVRSKSLSTAAREATGKNVGLIGAKSAKNATTKDEVLGLASAFERLAASLELFKGKGNSLMSTIKGITVPRKTIRNIQELTATLKTMGVSVAGIKDVASSTQAAFKSFGFGTATSRNLVNIRDAVEDYYRSVVKIRPLSTKIEQAFDKVGTSLEGNSTRIENAAVRLSNAVNKIAARIAVLAIQLDRSAQNFLAFRESFKGINTDLGLANDPVKHLRTEVTHLKNEAKETADYMSKIGHNRYFGGGGNNGKNRNNGFFGGGGNNGKSGKNQTNVLSGGFHGLSKAVITLNNALQTTQSILAGLNIYPGQIVKGFIDAGMKVEDLSTRMLFLTGSTKEASGLINSMGQFATKVPFDYENVLESATRFVGVAQGDVVEETKKWMPMIADLAAVSGLSIEETTSQVIRMYSAGAQAADMFRERGILAMLGFKTGVKYTVKETRGALEGAYTMDESKIRGASKALANNMKGILSMIADKYFLFQNKVMENGAFATFKYIVGGYDYMFEQYSNQVDSFAVKFGNAIGDALDYANTKFIHFSVSTYDWINNFIIGLGTIKSAIGPENFNHLLEVGKTGSLLWLFAAFAKNNPYIASIIAAADGVSFIGKQMNEMENSGVNYSDWAKNTLLLKDGITGKEKSTAELLSVDAIKEITFAYYYYVSEYYKKVFDIADKTVLELGRRVGKTVADVVMGARSAKDQIDAIYSGNENSDGIGSTILKGIVEDYAKSYNPFTSLATFLVESYNYLNEVTEEGLGEQTKIVDSQLSNQSDMIRYKISDVGIELFSLEDLFQDVLGNVAFAAKFGFADISGAIRTGFLSSITAIKDGKGSLANAWSSVLPDANKQGPFSNLFSPMTSIENYNKSGATLPVAQGDDYIKLLYSQWDKNTDVSLGNGKDLWDVQIAENAKKQKELQELVKIAKSKLNDESSIEDILTHKQLEGQLHQAYRTGQKLKRDKELKGFKPKTQTDLDDAKKGKKEKELDINDFLDQLREAEREFESIGWSDYEKTKFDILSEFDDSKYKNASADIKAVIEQIKIQKIETLNATKAIEDNASAIQHQGSMAAASLPSWQSYSKQMKEIETQFESGSIGASVDRLKELQKEMKRAKELIDAEAKVGLVEQIADLNHEISKISMTDKAREIADFQYELAKLVDPELEKRFPELTKNLKEFMNLKFRSSQIITFEDGFKDGLRNIQNNFQTTGEAISQFMTDIFSGLSSGLEDVFFNIFKGNLKDAAEAMSAFADAIMQSVAQIMANQIASQLMSGIGGMFGSAFGIMHSGGVVGSSATTKRSRHLNPALFVGAPRFHKGLMPDEFPAILQRGEMVIPKNGFSSGGGKQDVTVNIRNESGEQLKVSKATSSGDMSQMVIDIVVDGIARNRSGLRTMLSTAR